MAIGYQSLRDQDAGAHAENVAIGFDSGRSMTTGVYNTIIGSRAGDALTTGDNNIIIGKDAAASAVGVDNETVIGTTTTTSALVHGLKQPVTSANANVAAAAATPNTIYTFRDADGATVTLPDSGAGAEIGKTYEFVVLDTATSNSHKVVCTDTTNERIIGQLNMIDIDTSSTETIQVSSFGAEISSINLNGTTTGVFGSRFRITNVANDIWMVEGNIHHTGNVATPFATS